ncbi:MAG: nicotinate (nicotinamide) nucleotide adenylyltransferase [Bacteroidia bacterium]|jgi:nicotinate-nucleotide adenylyltransferase|nr:nicotinate (nicotinamide) nucleotide adenylyltransferase [Bacteroidia bacterium]GIV22688.1 MAG: putative nicotinate-nucleotide adenylyltransferase [Bacteroidia bacterium]
MKIGLLFGSFNPIHMGHLILARYWLNETDLAEIWLIVSPHNPHKSPAELAPAVHRLTMARLAIAEDTDVRVCDIEFHLPEPSYTIDTLQVLQTAYPHEWVVLLGADTAATVPTWKEGHVILQNWTMWVYPRKNTSELHLPISPRLRFFAEAPRIDLSATQIRTYLAQKRSIRYLVPPAVEAYIQTHNLYVPSATS